MADLKQRSQQLVDSEKTKEMDKAFSETTPRDLSAMDDKQLAEWHSKFLPQHPGYLLAQNEWNRRLLRDEINAIKWGVKFGAVVSLAVAIITVALTYAASLLSKLHSK